MTRALRHAESLDADWPPWIPIVGALMPVANAFVVAAQRDLVAFGMRFDVVHLPPDDPLRWTAVVAFLAAAPWVADAVAAAVFWRTGAQIYVLPRWLFAAVVLVATTALVTRPTTVDFAPFFLVLLAAQSAALMPRWQAAIVALASIGVMAAVEYLDIFDGATIWMFGIAFGYVGGAMVGGQVRLTTRLRATQVELTKAAASDERRRIAREIHDVIAHSLTVTMLHVTAARLALRDDPDEARDALVEAERLGRQSLDDIRRTVGLLDADDDAGRPQPGVEDLDDLVADFVSAGLDVSYRVMGDVAPVAPAAGLAVYRIAQESLANAAKHAPGSRVDVLLDATDGLRLRVRNSAPTRLAEQRPGGGHGIEGMRERAHTLGGTFVAAPADGGWVVEVTLPNASPDDHLVDRTSVDREPA